MTLYVSQYLNFYPSRRKTVILFNGISGAIDEVDQGFGRALKMSRHAGGPLGEELLRKTPEQEIAFLRKRGHVTTAAPAEEHVAFRNYVEKIHRLEREKGKRNDSLMIVPSYYCNLRCPYCFQSGLHRTADPTKYAFMDAAAVDELFERIIPQLLPHVTRLERLELCLYGGEPFLPHTEAAVNRIMDYAARHQMKVSAISNSTEIHRFLRWFGPERGKVSHVQVSLDGDKPWHNRSRIGHDQRETFETILENIHHLLDRRVRVNIRINSTDKNVEGIAALTERLKAEELLSHPYVHAYAWAVHNHGHCQNAGQCLTNWKLARIVEERAPGIQSPTGRREKRLRKIIEAAGIAAPLRTSFCMRTSPNSFLIDPHWDIYGCYEEAGRKELRVGSYSREGGVQMEPSYAENITRHVATVSPCDRCSVALTCGGGCPYAAKAAHGTQFREDCDNQKQCVARAIQRLVEEKTEASRSDDQNAELWERYPNA